MFYVSGSSCLRSITAHARWNECQRKRVTAEVEHFQKEINALRFELKKEQNYSANTKLKSQELVHQIKTLKWQSFELAEQKQRLLEDRIGLKGENKELKKIVKNCEGQLRDMHNQIKSLVKHPAQLENELNDIRAQSQQIFEANRQIEEYKTSPEQTETVVEQFDKGYQFTKAKIKAADFDLVLFGFSRRRNRD